MLLNAPDKDWEKIGRKDPYFGVLRHPEYRTRSPTREAREQFFQSGEARIRTVIDTVEKHLGVAPKLQRVLDFGCGVGRLLIPLARMSGEATGIDISESMLAEAQRNCEARGVGNVTVACDLSALEGSYDFIHSHIVFQHMKVARGEAVFAQLRSHLAPGESAFCTSRMPRADSARRFAGSFFRAFHSGRICSTCSRGCGRRRRTCK